MAAPAKQPDDLDLRGRASLHLSKAHGDVQRATKIFVDEVIADQKMYRALMDPLVRAACYDLVAAVCRSRRQRIWQMPQPTGAEQKQSVVHLGGGIAAALMNFPLPGGLPLRKATRTEVAEAAEFYQRQGDDMLVKQRWLTLIAQHLPAEKTVGESLTEKRLAELRAAVQP